MAVKKIQIIPEGSNDYADILHPETSVDMVVGLDRFGTASGTNSYVVSIPNTTLSEGTRITVKFTNANTGASTLNVNGQGAKSITKAGGAALSAGNIKAGGIYSLAYGGTSFQLLGEGGEYGTATQAQVLTGYTLGTDNGVVSGTMPNSTTNHTLAINGSFTIPAGYHNGTGKVTQSITTLGAKTYTPGASAQTIASGQYLSGTQTISAVSGLSAGNIAQGKVVGGVTGTYKGLGNATAAQVLSGSTFSTASLSNATGTMTNRGAVTNTITTQGGSYTIPSGYHSGSGKVTASFSNLVAGNVKNGVNIGGVTGTLLPFNSFSQKVTAPTYFHEAPGFIQYIGGKFVAGAGSSLFTSTDGLTWSDSIYAGTSGNARGIAYGQSKYILAHADSIKQSTNLNSWAYIDNNFSSKGVSYTNGIHFENGVWVVVTNTGVLRTTNVNSWNSWTQTYYGDLKSVACDGTTWVVGGTYKNSSWMLSSTDPMGTWTARTSGFGTSTINKIVYANGLFVAVGNDGKISTSTNGTSWTARTSNFDGKHIYDVAYGNGLWLAVGTGMRINYSTNGTTWIPMNVPGYDNSSITAIGFGINKFVLRGLLDIRIFNT